MSPCYKRTFKDDDHHNFDNDDDHDNFDNDDDHDNFDNDDGHDNYDRDDDHHDVDKKKRHSISFSCSKRCVNVHKLCSIYLEAYSTDCILGHYFVCGGGGGGCNTKTTPL